MSVSVMSLNVHHPSWLACPHKTIGRGGYFTGSPSRLHSSVASLSKISQVGSRHRPAACQDPVGVLKSRAPTRAH